MQKSTFKRMVAACIALLAIICSPSGEEPQSVFLRVQAEGNGLQVVTNDHDWSVELSALRVAVRNIEFTIEGGTHARTPRRFPLLPPRALAHPGHYAGGEVTGELSGEYLVDFFSPNPQILGEAELLPGDYNGINLYFRRTSESDGLEQDDPLLGHTAFMEGTASKADETVAFTAVVDAAEDTQMVGGPLELEVSADTSDTLVLSLYTLDPSESDTLFDGLDFALLDEDGDGVVEIEPGQTAHNILMKTLIRHDHFGMEVRPDGGQVNEK